MWIWYDNQFRDLTKWGVGRFRQTDKRYSSTNHRGFYPTQGLTGTSWLISNLGLKSGRDGTMLQSTDGLESSNGWMMSKRCKYFPWGDPFIFVSFLNVSKYEFEDVVRRSVFFVSSVPKVPLFWAWHESIQLTKYRGFRELSRSYPKSSKIVQVLRPWLSIETNYHLVI